MSEVPYRVGGVSNGKYTRSASTVFICFRKACFVNIAEGRGQLRGRSESSSNRRSITGNLDPTFGRHSHEAILVVNKPGYLIVNQVYAQQAKSLGASRIRQVSGD
jgi:hypothetical protein